MKKQLFSIALLIGVLGLSGCGKSSIDPSSLSDNLKAIDTTQAVSMTRNAEAQLINVTKTEKCIDETMSSSLVPEIVGGRYDYKGHYESENHYYSDQITTSTASKTEYAELDISAKTILEEKSTDILWYAAAQDPLLVDKLSLYSTSTVENNNGTHSETSSIKTADFATAENVSNIWASERAFVIRSLTITSPGYSSSSTYGMDGDVLVGFKCSVSNVSSASPYAPNNTDISVKGFEESKIIVKYVEDSTYGWVLKSTYIEYSYSYLTDLFGKELEKPLESDHIKISVILDYGEMKAKGDLPTYVEDAKTTGYINVFDPETLIIADSSPILADPTYNDIFVHNNELKYKYCCTGVLHAGEYVSLSNYANQTSETPNYEVWGYSDLTSGRSFGVSDAGVANHNLIKVDYTGTYSIQFTLDSTMENIESFSIVYVGNL